MLLLDSPPYDFNPNGPTFSAESIIIWSEVAILVIAALVALMALKDWVDKK